MIIYKITNLINKKIYIGQTIFSIEKRFKMHCYSTNKKKCKSPISRSIKKYGKENFKIEEIVKADCIQMLNYLEMYYIYIFNSTNKEIGYNIRIGGNTSSIPNETKEKIRNTLIGHVHSDETKLKISNAHKGKKLTNEHKENVIKALTGRGKSDETKDKISKSLTGRKRDKSIYEKIIEKTSKAVCEYCSVTGKFINEYKSCNEAARIINVHQSRISICSRKNNLKCNGNFWLFKKDAIKIQEDYKDINILDYKNK